MRKLGFRRRQRFLTSPKRIGVLALAAIGDTVLASALMRDIKDGIPGCELILFTSRANSGLAGLIDACDACQTIHIGAPLRAVNTIRSAKADWLIDISPWPRLTALYAAASGAGRTVGFKTEGQFRHYAFDFPVRHRNDRHQLCNLQDLLRPLGIAAKKMPCINAPRRSISNLASTPFIVFHAWPGGYRAEYKRWPEAYWIELGRRISEEGYSVVLTGAAADATPSGALARGLAHMKVEVHNYSGGLTLQETASVLAASAAVISVDTGILHIAAALGVPTVGLHGPSPSRRWGAIGPHVVSIDACGDDCGFLSLGFEYPKAIPNCMERITPNTVWQALRELLSESRQLLAHA
jgi:heptosyltransferase I